jgi:hypothetical protein
MSNHIPALANITASGVVKDKAVFFVGCWVAFPPSTLVLA